MQKVKSFISGNKWWLVACCVCLAGGAVTERMFAKPTIREVVKVEERVVEKVVEVEKIVRVEAEKVVVDRGPKKTTKKKLEGGQVVEETVVEEGPEKVVSEKKTDVSSEKTVESEKNSERRSETVAVSSPRATWSVGVSVPASTVWEQSYQGVSVDVGYRVVGPFWGTVGLGVTRGWPSPSLGVRVEF